MELVQISGRPASGKTMGAKTLNPANTFYIDADSKGLPWMGASQQYNAANKNYVKASDATDIYKIVKGVHDNRKDINCIIIDTINTIMTNAEMEILKHPSRDQWADLCVQIFDLYKVIRELNREDIVVFVMAHIEPFDVNGITNFRTMTNGKKLTKINLNSFLLYNLYTKVGKGTDGKLEYTLVTQGDGTTEARSVYGMFDEIIPNDLEMVRKTIMQNKQ